MNKLNLSSELDVEPFEVSPFYRLGWEDGTYTGSTIVWGFDLDHKPQDISDTKFAANIETLEETPYISEVKAGTLGELEELIIEKFKFMRDKGWVNNYS